MQYAIKSSFQFQHGVPQSVGVPDGVLSDYLSETELDFPLVELAVDDSAVCGTPA
jgi:hypothetical protein